MPRFLLSALLICAAPPTFAAGDAAGNCAATSAIVADAVTLRADGTAQADAIETLETSDIEARFRPTVQPLVDWVYGLPREQVTEEAAAAFEAACLEQAGQAGASE